MATHEYIPLRFEFNDDEIKQLTAISSELETELDKLQVVTLYGREAIFGNEDAQKIISSFSKKILAIRKKAHERSIEYYSSHKNEIPNLLKHETQQFIIFMLEQEKDNLTPNPPEKYREILTYSITPYLDLICSQTRSDVLSYIDYAFENKKKFYTETTAHETTTAKRVRKITAPVDKVTQSIFNPSKTLDFYGEGVDLLVSKKGKKEVTTAVSLRIEDLEGVKMLTPYARPVLNAVISHILAGNSIISVNMINRTMTGKDTVEEKNRLAIIEAVNTLMRTWIKIDATQEAKAFNIQGLENWNCEGRLLEARLHTAKINGQILECYQILAEPLLLTYAKAKKQLDTYDISILNAPFQVISATPENSVIVNYLLERIMAMLNPNSRIKNIILYETLYKLTGINAPTEATAETKRRRTRKKIHAILDIWVKNGLINGYKDLDEDDNPATNGKTIAKIKISCSVKKQVSSVKKRIRPK